MACGDDAEARRGVAVDVDVELQARGLLVGGDVLELGQLLAARRAPSAPTCASSSRSASSSVYWYCVRLERPPMLHVLHRLQVERDPLDLGELRAQAGDDLVGAWPCAVASA